MTEAHTLANHLQDLAALAGSDTERIEIRGLCCPRKSLVKLQRLADALSNQFSTGVVECHRDLGITRSLHIHIQQALAVLIVLNNNDVLDVCLRTCIEIDLAGYTGEAPEVLVFQIRAVAPPHDLHGNEVLALLQVFRDVELGSHLRVFAIAHIFPVDPNLQVAGGRTHMEQHLLTGP